MNEQRAIIIGAGPAGLTAAFELLCRTRIRPIVLEQDDVVGGLSRTVEYKGNRIDIGGHRFFSKSDRVMQWWTDLLPLERSGDAGPAAPLPGDRGEGSLLSEAKTAPSSTDDVMLVRGRKSRIFFLGRLFDYPISPNWTTINNLGLVRLARMAASYGWAWLLPLRPEDNLERFLINRFGRELYLTFFKSYTEKVWGVPCNRISSVWGEQRIKGLSISSAIAHAFKSAFRRGTGVTQKDVETSLVEQFLYPKRGPGQLWELCADRVLRMGGEVRTGIRVKGVRMAHGRVASVVVSDPPFGESREIACDYVFSTIPIRDLVRGLDLAIPDHIRQISEGLVYRDLIVVGLLIDTLKIGTPDSLGRRQLNDNWIYIQEPDVRVGRMQIFNNWSPSLVADRSKTWIGLEYFCSEDDALWRLSDDEMAGLAIQELVKIGVIDGDMAIDQTVLHVPKAYPAYFGSYDRFDQLRAWLDGLENLYLIGRNGMHRYNNQDHSVLTAMLAVDNILAGRTDRSNIWNVNTEEEYHERR